MRLYLSSYSFGDHTDELVRMAGFGTRALMIGNPSDLHDATARKETVDRQLNGLKELGFETEELDLRDYFANNRGLKERIDSAGLIWVKGGNTFVLKRAIEQSGAAPYLLDGIRHGRFVYGGFSAGIILMTPTLRGIELCDEPERLPAGYKPEVDWDCLNIVPYSIIPHFRSDHHESEMMEDVLAYMQKHNMPYKTMQDGDVIIIDNGVERFLKKKEIHD